MDCQQCALEALNVSQITGLTRLYCNDNSIKELDISLNKELVRLECFGNPLSSLDVRNNPKLEMFLCNKDLPVSGAESGYEFQWEEAGEKGYETGYYYKPGLNVDLP